MLLRARRGERPRETHGYAPVAQLDRAFGCGPKGRGFKSLRAYQPKCRANILDPALLRLATEEYAGEVSEWLKVPLSKSGEVNSLRGFESHPLRPRNRHGRVA
jgi:hypothetical protein